MTPRIAVALAFALCAGCASAVQTQKTLAETEFILKQANAVHARVCAPVELANGESGAAFTHLEFQEGSVRRAQEHAISAHQWAVLALAKATPCGTADLDEDTIVDILDQCPEQPEDFDGVEDQDGCRDIDPNGDEDKDGIRNIDDGCVADPEDFDGDSDEDGCPETSEDSDGDSIIDAVDQCPEEPEDLDNFKDSDGCPDPDNDNDGVSDLQDRCGKAPEDRDQWEDDDGCPDPDNDLDGIPDINDSCPNEPGDRLNRGCPNLDGDKDGIADSNDQCPTEPETVNKYLDEDGCPDTPPALVVVTRTRIEIKETIQFETGSATLLRASLPVLNDVVQVLNDAKTIHLSIEGHTDSDGSDDYNLKLSQERAESVKAYIESRGIDAKRLDALGFGEEKPIDTNRTAAGRAVNRRVEFRILSQ